MSRDLSVLSLTAEAGRQPRSPLTGDTARLSISVPHHAPPLAGRRTLNRLAGTPRRRRTDRECHIFGGRAPDAASLLHVRLIGPAAAVL